jgi:hypothetical protein
VGQPLLFYFLFLFLEESQPVNALGRSQKRFRAYDFFIMFLGRYFWSRRYFREPGRVTCVTAGDPTAERKKKIRWLGTEPKKDKNVQLKHTKSNIF